MNELLGDPACWSWPLWPESKVAEWYSAHAPYYGPSSLMYAWQEGRCAVCGVPNEPILRTDRHHLDHDHATGLIRGWLCVSCNKREGRKSAPAIEKYRQRSPAVILGIEEFYGGVRKDGAIKAQLRVQGITWKRFGQQAKSLNADNNLIIQQLLDWYIGEGELPKRPAAVS